MEGLANDLMTRRVQNTYMAPKTDKDDSLLTDSYREYLIHKPEPDSNGYQRKKRGRMRDRIRVGLGDFVTLNQKIESRDLKQIFDKRLDEVSGQDEHLKYGDMPELGEPDFGDTAMAYILTTHVVSFVYRGLRAIGNEPYQALNEAILRGALMGEAKHKGVTREYVGLVWDEDNERADIVVHDKSNLDPLEKWKRDLPLTPEERGQLHEELIEAVPEDVYQEATPADIDDLIAEYLVSED